MRYFFHISYKGTNYSGWQRQSTASSIQQVIEETLAKLFDNSIYIVGCGRTDAGVHARQYYFHVDINEFPDYDLVYKLNKMLPRDIAVYDIAPVAVNASARLDATSRQYTYHFHTVKKPFLKEESVFVESSSIDVSLMSHALDLLAEQTDFSAFCKTPEKHNTCICHIDLAKVEGNDAGDEYVITIRGNRFLRAMMRIIVYRVISVGTGKLSLEHFKRYFSHGNEGQQVLLMPPQGLYLDEVKYSGRGED